MNLNLPGTGALWLFLRFYDFLPTGWWIFTS